MSAEPTPIDTSDMRSLFLSSGQLGQDLLAVDWASTPLGPIDDWPQSLKTIVHVVVTSRFSMWMAWGSELTFFANESYRRDTLGAKYPWALGKPASEVWAEIWPDIGPRIDTVMTTGQASWDESLFLILERSGFAEETYHTFSYSPLTDDNGVIVGMLCVVTEDTKRVIGDQRMTILRDLAANMTSARTDVDVFVNAADALSANLGPLPFSLAYLFEENGSTARLALSVGANEGDPIAPLVIDVGDDDAWPTGDALAGRSVVVDDLGTRFGSVPSRDGFNPPEQAIVLPLPSHTGERPYGFLVAALSAYQPFDPEYRGFISLVASQIAGAIANARAYEAERQRAERLAELDDAKTRFFTNVSHEFRTPLTLLLGPASDSLTDRVQPLPEVQRERIELVHRNGERLLRLVNSLLDFSRLESGQVDAEFEPVDLALYTTQLASMFRAAIERAGITLNVECPPLGEDVFIDREMWAKIVSNLLSNALKFTFEGSITVQLGEMTDDDGSWIELSVVDTGIGIPDAEQAHLFERFHRVAGARARTFEGSGIGLALVDELAAIHGGTVRASSSLGVGSTFAVRIPLGAAHLTADRIAHLPSDRTHNPEILVGGFVEEAMRWLDDATVPSRIAEGEGGDEVERPLVLVADDNADMRQYVASLLADLCEVVTVSDGQEALEFVQTRTPDLVLTDVMMPNLDGFGLLSKLRNGPATSRVPVIMLSARAGEEAAVGGLTAGADDYLVKPFSALELVARVRSNLELDRARREASERERQIAYELQHSLMPSEHFTVEKLEIATFYQAGVQGTQVGGDWYDVIELGAGRTALVIGDVMGRGVRAAAVMGQVRSAIRAFARMDLPPANILEFLDQTVSEFADGQIVTCIYGIYDPADRTFTFGNAGHLPPLVKVEGSPTTRLEGGLSAPLGSNPPQFRQAQIVLPDHAVITMYTDGLVERRGQLLDDRIDEAAKVIDSSTSPIAELVAELIDRLCPDGSEDDVAILSAQLPTAGDPWAAASFVVAAEEGAATTARARIRACLDSWEVPQSVAEDVVLLGSELVTNAIIHGHPPIELRIRRTATQVVLEVFDAANFHPKRRQPAADEEHGRGLGIVEVLARDWGTRITDGGKAVWCAIEIPSTD